MATNTSTIGGSSPDYSTVALWEAATDNDLVTAGDIEKGLIQTEMSISSAVTIGGATTDASNYRELTYGGTGGARYDPIADTGSGVVSTGAQCILVEENYVRLTGLQFAHVGTSSSQGAVQASSGRDYLLMDGCTVRNTGTSGACVYGLGANAAFRNSLWITDGDYGSRWVANNVEWSNVVIYDAGTGGNYGLRTSGSNTGLDIRNCAIYGFAGTADYSVGSGTQSNNISSDTSAPGTSSHTSESATDVHTDPSSDDFTIKSSGNGWDGGTDLSGTFTTSLDGTTRSGTWDIGCYDSSSSSSGVTGSGTAALGGLAGSGTGALEPEGSGTAALGGLSATASTGTYGPTGGDGGDPLPSFTGLAGSGTGTFTGGGTPVTGSGTAALSGLAGAGTGAYGPTGSGSGALSGLAGSGTGWLPVSGSGTAALGGLAGSGEGSSAGLSVSSLQGLACSGTGSSSAVFLPATLTGITGYGIGGIPGTGSGTASLAGLLAVDGVGTSTYTVSGSGTGALSGLASVATGKAFVPVTGSGVASLSGLTTPERVEPSLLGIFCTGTAEFANPTAPSGSGTASLGGLAAGNPRLRDPAQTSDDTDIAPVLAEDAEGSDEYRFHIGFQYLHEDHVIVLLNGEPITVGVTVDKTVSVAHPHGEVVLDPDLTGYSPGEEIVIMRVTPNANLWNVFVGGADVQGQDANAAMKQLLYVTEELELLLKPSANPTVRIPTHIRLPAIVTVLKNPTWYQPKTVVTATTVKTLVLNMNLGLLPATKFIFPGSVTVTSATLLALRNLEGKIRWEGHDVLAGMRHMTPPATYAANHPNYVFAEGAFTVGVEDSWHADQSVAEPEHKTGRTMRAIMRTQTDANDVHIDWWFFHYWGDTENSDIVYTEIPEDVFLDTSAGRVTLGDWDCGRLGLSDRVAHGASMICRARMQFDSAGDITVEDVVNPLTTGQLPPFFRSITPATTSTAKEETLTNWMNDLMGTEDDRPQFDGNSWCDPFSGRSGDQKSFGFRHFDVDIWAASNTAAREAQVFSILKKFANRVGHLIEPYTGKIKVVTEDLILSNAGGFYPASSDYKDIAFGNTVTNAWDPPSGSNWFNHPSSSQQGRGNIVAAKYHTHQGTNNQHWDLTMLAAAAYRWNDVGLWHELKHCVDMLIACAPETNRGGTYHNINPARGRGRVLMSCAVLWHLTKDSRLEEYAAKLFDNMYLTLASNPVNNPKNYQDDGVPTRSIGAAAFEVAFWIMGLRAVQEAWPAIRNITNFAACEESLCLWMVKAWKENVPGHSGTWGVAYGLLKDASAAWPGQETHAKGTAKQCIGSIQVALRHHSAAIAASADPEIYVSKAEAIVAEWQAAKVNTTANWDDAWRWMYE